MASFLFYTWSVTIINLHHFHFIHLLISTHLLTMWAKWNAFWNLHWVWSPKSERGRRYDSWMRVRLELLKLVVLPAPKIDFLHCAGGPYLAVWCLCYLSMGGSFPFFQRCFTHFIFTNRATRSHIAASEVLKGPKNTHTKTVCNTQGRGKLDML